MNRKHKRNLNIISHLSSSSSEPSKRKQMKKKTRENFNIEFGVVTDDKQNSVRLKHNRPKRQRKEEEQQKWRRRKNWFFFCFFRRRHCRTQCILLNEISTRISYENSCSTLEFVSLFTGIEISFISFCLTTDNQLTSRRFHFDSHTFSASVEIHLPIQLLFVWCRFNWIKYSFLSLIELTK